MGSEMKKEPAKMFTSVLLLSCLMFLSGAAAAAESPQGLRMAEQTQKFRLDWNTTDHAKHRVLQQDFTSGEQITEACLSCHSEADDQFYKTIHWTWQAEGEGGKYGKAGYSVNNFCISTNKTADKSCLACHPGWGTSRETSVNCLNCHSSKKMNWDEAFADIQAFLEDGDADSVEIAREIQQEVKESVQSVGRPGRANCGSCHFFGGGGDGVKHGDLDTSLTNPSRSLDVHMGTDGQNLDCVRCHNTHSHNIAGRIYTRPAAENRKSLVEDDQVSKITCESCHTAQPHRKGTKINHHTDRVACQSCHIPEFARVNPTKMSWDWSKAGDLKDGKPYKTEDEFGKHDYMSIKGKMRWDKNVVPRYYWFNGVIGSITAKDRIDPAGTVRISWPEGSRDDANARIYPFKVHKGKQPYDKVNNTLLAPLLSTPDGYWRKFDWQLALSKGQEALGLPYSGHYGFVETTYVYPITHMVAPREDAVACTECHTRNGSRLAGLTGFYMPGRDRFDWLDGIGWVMVLGSLVGVFFHGLGRVFTRGRRNG